MDIRELLPPEDGKRVETGVVQFGSDWPGFFFRGDASPSAESNADALSGLVEAFCRICGAGWAEKFAYFGGAQELGYLLAECHLGQPERTEEQKRAAIEKWAGQFEKTLHDSLKEKA